MYYVNIAQDVPKDQQLQLLKYLVSLSDKFSISRYYHGHINRHEFEEVQNRYMEKLIERAKNRKSDYAKNFGGYKDRIDSMFNTNESAMKYLDELDEQDFRIYDSVTMDETEDGFDHLDIDGIISYYYTRMTHVTEGPIQQVIYLEKDVVQEQVINKLEGLFTYPYVIQGHEFEDLVLYRDERVLLTICSHERDSRMILNQNEAQMIVDLNFIKKDALVEV